MSTANNKSHVNKGFGMISNALSGTTGGALIGSSFGIVGSIVGGIVGGIITGYSGYKSGQIVIHKKRNSAI